MTILFLWFSVAIMSTWALHRDSLYSIIPFLSSFLTSVAINCLSSCEYHFDFTSMQSGVKFAKSDGYHTLASY